MSRRRSITIEKTYEELQKEREKAEARVEQYQHQVQRLENRIRYYTEGERKKRNHHLITRSADMESLVPALRSLSRDNFYQLAEQIFSLPEVIALVNRAIDQQEGG